MIYGSEAVSKKDGIVDLHRTPEFFETLNQAAKPSAGSAGSGALGHQGTRDALLSHPEVPKGELFGVQKSTLCGNLGAHVMLPTGSYTLNPKAPKVLNP